MTDLWSRYSPAGDKTPTDPLDEALAPVISGLVVLADRITALEKKLDGLRKFVSATAPRKPKK